MTAHVIFDVEIHGAARYQEFPCQVRPALEVGGARYPGGSGRHMTERCWAWRACVEGLQ